MAFANPNISDLVASTLENRDTNIADNISASNAILAFLNKKGNSKLVDGGQYILEPLFQATNTNATSYTGYDTFTVGASDVVSGARFDFKQYAAPVSVNGTQLLLNAGKSKVIDLLLAQIEAAEITLKNLVVQGLYSDGTTNSGKGITGLQAAVPLVNTTGTYGGIDRATNTFWRNKKFKATTDGGAATTSANIQGYMNTLWNQLVRGTDKPTLGIMDPAYYSMFQASLQVNQRFTDPKTAELGFQNIMYNSAPIIFDQAATGLPAKTLYFLNLDYMAFRTHRDRNFSQFGGTREAINQDAQVTMLGWAGNLTCRGQMFQGVMQE